MNIERGIEMLVSRDGDLCGEGRGSLSYLDGLVKFDERTGDMTINLYDGRYDWEKDKLIREMLKDSLAARMKRIIVEPWFSYNYRDWAPNFRCYNLTPKQWYLECFDVMKAYIHMPSFMEDKYKLKIESLEGHLERVSSYAHPENIKKIENEIAELKEEWAFEEQEIIARILSTYKAVLGIKTWTRRASAWNESIVYEAKINDHFSLELEVAFGGPSCQVVNVPKIEEEISNNDGEYVNVNGVMYQKTNDVVQDNTGKMRRLRFERRIDCTGEE